MRQDVELERAIVAIASVRSRLLDPETDAIGYARIRAFQSSTGDEVALLPPVSGG